MAGFTTRPSFAGHADALAIRELVETVTVSRGDKPGSIQIEISGRLGALIGEKAFPHGIKSVWGKLVAGEGFEPPTSGL